MSDSDLVAAVKAVKLSSTYRELRPMITNPMPADVWEHDDGRVDVVLFRVAPAPETFESFVGFVVERKSRRLIRNERLDVGLTADGWSASNSGSPLAKEMT